MNVSQFPQNELAIYFDKIFPIVKKNKVKSLLVFILLIFYLSIPAFQIPILQYNGFRVTSLMEQRAIEHRLVFYPRQSWVDIDDVKPALLKSIISLEDGSFFTHNGVDWKELKNSIKLNQRHGRISRGGSTITMQLSKNLYFTTKKSFFRKAKEMVVAFRMEKENSKKVILENYINAVEWGEGIFGIRRASEIYFNKEPGELTTSECTKLAAVIPSPLIHQPNKNSKYVLRRASIAQRRLNDIILYPKN